MNSKKLTVGYSNHYTSNELRPKITMEGKWLEELGFHVGDRLCIEYEEGVIRILPALTETLMVAEPQVSYPAKKKSGKAGIILR